MSLQVYIRALLCLEVAAIWLALSPSLAQATPVLSGVETRTKNYFYGSYPPDNPTVRTTRTITVTEPTGQYIASASIVMWNSTVEDKLSAPSDKLSQHDLDVEFYPKEGMSMLYIYGNATARAYQNILRYVTYTAPLSYLKTSEETRFWRNITYKVTNEGGEVSNTVTRPLRIDAVWKRLIETFPGYTNDMGAGGGSWLLNT